MTGGEEPVEDEEAGGEGGAEEKIAAMEEAGIRVSPSPSLLGTTLAELLETV